MFVTNCWILPRDAAAAADDNNNNNNNNMKREMSQCCGIKQCTQTEKLQQIDQI